MKANQFPAYQFPDRSGPQELGTPFQRIVIVGITGPDDIPDTDRIEEDLYELSRLVETLDGTVVQSTHYRLHRIHPQYYLGPGKADALGTICDETLADTVVIDASLTPIQIKHLEYETGSHVMDRKELILEIFARRAKTAESKIQVELAYLNFTHPRMAHDAKSQRRVRGGLRGAGERSSALKTRPTRQRKQYLLNKLQHIEKQRAEQHKRRTGIPTIALVGYTNAGKSTLLTALSGESVYADDRLFATLDTTTRRVMLPNNMVVLCSDTVGFIRRLPHELVASFRSTLSESVQAQMLLHVLDASSQEVVRQMQAVDQTLEELGASHQPRLVVLNKIDRVDNETLADLQLVHPDTVALSAKTGEGIEQLKLKIAQTIENNHAVC